MTAGCVLGCGWREDKLLQKCAGQGRRPGRLDSAGGSAWGCEGELRSVRQVALELLMLLEGERVCKGPTNPAEPQGQQLSNVCNPAPSFPSTEEKGENPLTFLGLFLLALGPLPEG